MRPFINKLLTNVLQGCKPSYADIADIVPLLETELLEIMAAAKIAASHACVKPFTCGIINAKSGLCGENCAFCAQSVHSTTHAGKYPLLPESEVLARADFLAQRNVDYMGIVVSGGSPGEKDLDAICGMAEKIRRSVGIKLCASLGMLDEKKARMVRSAGFTSYHHNLETSRSYYPAICTSHEYNVREQTVRVAKTAGLRVCSGGIFGLGETWRHRFEMSLALAALDVDSIPINFLTPIEGTPLGRASGPTPREALSIISLFRLMHPERDLVVCGGRERSLGNCMPLLFSAGANGIMVGDYLTVKGSAIDIDIDIMQTLGLARTEKR